MGKSVRLIDAAPNKACDTSAARGPLCPRCTALAELTPQERFEQAVGAFLDEVQVAPAPALTIAEAAQQLNASPNFVGSLCLSGKLPSIRVGEKFVRIKQSDLDDFISRKRNVRRVSSLKPRA